MAVMNIAYDDGKTITSASNTTAPTIISAASGMSLTGVGRSGPLFAQGPRKIVTGTITLDDSYNNTGTFATSGEDISDIWKQFTPSARDSSHNATTWQLQHIVINNAVIVAGVLRLAAIDETNMKLHVFTALGTEAANASDQSAVVVRFLAWGR
jgi:hypothetical protein